MSDVPMPDHQTPTPEPQSTKIRPSNKRRMIGGRWLWIGLLLLFIGVGVQQLLLCASGKHWTMKRGKLRRLMAV